MSRFQKYLNEEVMYVNLSKEPTDNTVGSIDVDDPDYDRVLNKVKNTIIGSTLKEYIEFLFSNSGYTNVDKPSKDSIMQLMEDEFKGDAEDIEELKNIGLYEISLADGSVDSVSNIASKYSDYFDKSFFRRLAKTDLKQTVEMGKGEIILGLYTQLQNSLKEGDLQTPGGEKIEVKKAKGRTKGGKNPPAKKASQALEELQDKFNIEPTHKSIGKEMLDKIVNSLDEKTINDSDKMKSLIKILQQYPGTKISNDHVTLIQKILKNRDERSFYTYMLALHLDAYRKLDEFQYFLVFDNDINKFIIFNVMKPFSGIYKVAQNFKMGAGWADLSKDSSFQIIPKI